MAQPLDLMTVMRIHGMRAVGCSQAEIAAEIGITRRTVKKYVRGMPMAACLCGRPGGHAGWCHARLDLKPARRQQMRAMAGHNRKWNDAALALVRREWEGGTEAATIAGMVGHGTTPHAIAVAAAKMKARRPKDYVTRIRSAQMTRRWVQLAVTVADRAATQAAAMPPKRVPAVKPPMQVVQVQQRPAPSRRPFTGLALSIPHPTAAPSGEDLIRKHVSRI